MSNDNQFQPGDLSPAIQAVAEAERHVRAMSARSAEVILADEVSVITQAYEIIEREAAEIAPLMRDYLQATEQLRQYGEALASWGKALVELTNTTERQRQLLNQAINERRATIAKLKRQRDDLDNDQPPHQRPKNHRR